MTRIAALDQFRAIAILMIVILHCGRTFLLRGPAPPVPDSNLILALNDILFHNATLYFTMISGIVYARSLWRKPFPVFLKGRFTNVIVPYVVVTTVLTVGTALLLHRTDRLPAELVHNLLLGEGFYMLWYIPVIGMLYLISPLLLRITRTPRLIWLTVLLALLPLVFSRIGTEVTTSTTVYFLGAYVVALVLGSDLEKWLGWAARHQRPLWAISLIASLVLLFMYRSGMAWWGITDLRESLFYIQRLASGMALLAVLYQIRPISSDRINRWLSATAAMAFGLYFLHAPMIRLVIKGMRATLSKEIYWTHPLVGIPIVFIVTMIFCLAAIKMIRRIAGRYSKFLIGA